MWTHSQGVYPLRDALARTLKLDPATISVRHVQGPGCYGHNGADDAAADAAVIAMQTPGKPVRVRWRREEEFGFEPVSPAMVVTAHAVLDDGRAARPTGRPRSGAGGTRAGRAAAAICSPPKRCPTRRRAPPADRVVEPARRRHAQWRAALRVSGKAHRPSPDRRDAGAHLVVARARRHAQCLRDRIVDGRAGRARRRGPGRLPAVGIDRSAGPRGHRAGRAAWPTGGGVAGRHRPGPRHRLRPLQEHGRLCRGRRRGRGRRGGAADRGCGAPPMPVLSSIRTARSTSSKAASSRARAGP